MNQYHLLIMLAILMQNDFSKVFKASPDKFNKINNDNND
jgi:hypothetical protein